MTDFSEQYQQLVEHAPTGIFYTDSQGRCIYSNPEWQAIFQLSFDQALGDGWAAPLHPDDHQRTSEGWHRAVKAEKTGQTGLNHTDVNPTVSTFIM